MNPILRNTLAAISGVVVGSVVNMGLINAGPLVVPLPEGAATAESFKASLDLYSPINFLFPFLAHALGTLSGAAIAARIAASREMLMALGVGVFFLAAGAMMVGMVGGPVWFSVGDLLLAYLPMGYLGGILGKGKSGIQ